MFFQQTMGTICASPYASIFMQKMERQILNHEPHSINFRCRFIDDCFFIFTHGEDKLHKVLTFMNAIHPTINFTFKYSKTSIDLLDTSDSHWAGWKTVLQSIHQTHWHLSLIRLQVKPSSRNFFINYLLTSA